MRKEGTPPANDPSLPGNPGVRGESSEVAGRAAGKQGSIVVCPRQRGNPVLKFIRNVPWEFGEVKADYVLGQTTVALYLSLRYHCLHPDYVHQRLGNLGKDFALRILLVQVDTKNPHDFLKDLARICILADCTLILTWSFEETARYLETYKMYENKPADMLKEKVEQDYISKVTDCLTTVKSVNRTDCITLISTFKTLADIVESPSDQISLCPGLGPHKARRLQATFQEPFLRNRGSEEERREGK